MLVAGAYVLAGSVSSTTERRADVAADASETTHQEAREGNEPVRLRSGVDGEQPPSPALRARLEAAGRLPSVEARRAALR